jgi:hypothetical protein
MTRFKSLFAAAAASAIVALAPAANAQTGCGGTHFVGAGSSAQFTMAAIAADQAALNANSACYSGAYSVKHFTFKSGANVVDNRDSLNRIETEIGNIWFVWIEDGSGNVTDTWFDESVDSTVGNRAVLAQETSGSGATIQVLATTSSVPAGLISPNTLWPDNNADVALDQNAINAINGQHINVGLTDIRPEDALFATNRSKAALNTTTYAGLGYVGPTSNIGAPILTDQGTGTSATPIAFALPGKEDPFTKITVPSTFVTVPIGAAPIVFIANNNSSSTFPRNLVSGVTPGVHESGQVYPLADLFDGTTSCDTDNAAFGGNNDGNGTALTILLREPLSGTMNTTEYSLFRSDGQDATGLYNSQEVGIINPTRSPYNPLSLNCNGKGSRQRAIGTGEVVNAVLADNDSLGYIFWGFSNAAKYKGESNYNYMTLDGVDPLGMTSTLVNGSAQNLPYCTSATCSASLFWPGSNSFPNLRNGTYKAWSIYRWVTQSTGTSDPYGPFTVAQLAQDYVDSDVTDFVPFLACPSGDTSSICGGQTNTDGLSVYHSHFTQSSVTGNNGAKTPANNFNGGNTLGGGSEAGGDEGGLIEGPFGATQSSYNGYVEWHTATVVKDGATVVEVQHKAGPDFVAGAAWVGQTIYLNGTAQVVQGCPVSGVNKCNPTTTTLYVGAVNPASSELIEVPYSFDASYTPALAATPGVLSKKQ